MHGKVQLLHDDDRIMLDHGLSQPAGAAAAWQRHIELDLDTDLGSATCLSERMVLYKTTRGAYDPETELTVSYGSPPSLCRQPRHP